MSITGEVLVLALFRDDVMCFRPDREIFSWELACLRVVEKGICS